MPKIQRKRGMNGMKRILAGAMALSLLLTAGCGSASGTDGKDTAQAAFEPKLDTDASVELNICGFFGNFEALDQVELDFNEHYPNVTFTYQQVGGKDTAAFLDANPDTDIFMTALDTADDLRDRCADLSDLDLSAIDEELLTAYGRDGKQAAIPIGQNLYGVIVNKSLIEKEGLSMPTDEKSWLNDLAALKAKGYTPIQGPDSKVYAELTAGMVFSQICADDSLRKGLKNGDADAAEKLRPALDFLGTIIGSGYTNLAVNQTYPADNYDEAILHFFEGDVPFWVCNTEKVSGMKKRESKSEAFTNAPFEYEYIYPPIGEAGEYVYQEPWYGFSVNENGANKDYAMEFVRFLAGTDEINKMADIKGVPSVAKQPTDNAIYRNVLAADVLKNRAVNDGTITAALCESWYACTNKLGRGECTEDEALDEFLAACEAAL